VASWEPTERVAVPSVQQGWEALTFVHFPYHPDVVAALLPEPLVPDLHDGTAWVGITPFRLRAAVLPVAPGPRRTYVEVNVRTYVRHPDGRDAIWFLSLELDQLAVVTALRTALGLPYRRSRTRIEEDATTVRYGVRRRLPLGRGELDVQVAIGEPLEHTPGALETFLVGRWRAVTERAGRLLWVPVEHQPWDLARADLVTWRSERFLESVGLPEPAADPHVLFSRGVDVRLGWPRR
jgi:uncharacterized protein YqjF (DUF2071 family)